MRLQRYEKFLKYANIHCSFYDISNILQSLREIITYIGIKKSIKATIG